MPKKNNQKEDTKKELMKLLNLSELESMGEDNDTIL